MGQKSLESEKSWKEVPQEAWDFANRVGVPISHKDLQEGDSILYVLPYGSREEIGKGNIVADIFGASNILFYDSDKDLIEVKNDKFIRLKIVKNEVVLVKDKRENVSYQTSLARNDNVWNVDCPKHLFLVRRNGKKPKFPKNLEEEKQKLIDTGKKEVNSIIAKP